MVACSLRYESGAKPLGPMALNCVLSKLLQTMCVGRPICRLGQVAAWPGGNACVCVTCGVVKHDEFADGSASSRSPKIVSLSQCKQTNKLTVAIIVSRSRLVQPNLRKVGIVNINLCLLG